MDVKEAFLSGDIDKEVYVYHFYNLPDEGDKGTVYHFQNALLYIVFVKRHCNG